jgi:predicted nucleic acid-binding Zn finger protein
MSKPHAKELELLETFCKRVSETGKLPSLEGLELDPSFQKRIEKALRTVRDRLVSRYAFAPSRRIVWTVRGRSGEYQIMPKTNFCSCNDFYFRVMGYKRQFCYHIVAQKIAESLKLYNNYELRDREYDQLTEKWRVKPPAEEED